MKDRIHPRYVECTVTCGCGNTFVTRATAPSLTVEICSSCHPFYTGKQKFVDTEGRVKKFENRHGWGKDAMDKLLSKKEKRVTRREKVSVGVPKVKKRKEQSDEDEKKADKKAKPAAGARSKAPEGKAAETKADAGGGAPKDTSDKRVGAESGKS